MKIEIEMVAENWPRLTYLLDINIGQSGIGHFCGDTFCIGLGQDFHFRTEGQIKTGHIVGCCDAVGGLF